MLCRPSRCAILCALFAALAVGVSGAIPAPDAAPKPAAPPPESPVSSLFKPRAFPGIDDPQTTLGEALTFIGGLYGVTIDVNEVAFRDDQVDDALKKPVGGLPKMTDASLDRVLRKLLARLPAASGAAYVVRADHIELTTRPAQIAEVWGHYNGPYLPLVHGDFESRPLGEVLQQLAGQAGVSVVVDTRAADKARTAVSASFTNLPLDTAVRLLADMAGLRSSLNDNVIYVSTEERVLNAPASAFGGGTVAGNPAQVALFAPARTPGFDKRPLQEALQELLKPTGMKLVVDSARVGDRNRTPVSANLEGASIEAAVRLLADMADLRPVIYDNVVYLTTKENALNFIKASEATRPDLRGPGHGLYGGAGLGGGFGALGGGAGLGGLGGLGGGPAIPR
jgi:hypothetical protein